MNVGIAGYGNVGREVARRLIQSPIDGLTLVGVTARDLDKARTGAPVDAMPLAQLVERCDVIVESATADAVPEIARAALGAGKMLTIVSAAGLLQFPDIAAFAHAHKARVRICSGALPGLDILRAAREGSIHSVKLKSRIKPSSMAHEPYIVERGFDLREPLAEPVRVFAGSAGDAGRAFPRHFNVAIALALAGIGLDHTEVEVWVESRLPGAIHRVLIEADTISLNMESRNKPSANPRTSRIVAPSILATLRALSAPFVVGN